MIRIYALGGLSIRDEAGASLPGAGSQPRRMAILALLARAGARGVSREKVLALLWPDTDDERGPRALTQALYALRKDLGAEDAVSGNKELRLDPALASSDVGEFASAVARGDDEAAASLYHGPFLDNFYVPGADEFSRWAEHERAALALDYSRALESLARAARAEGSHLASVAWWRKLAALEPLNARVTVGLMESLAAAGDVAGAVQHAHVYELLVEQELDLPPDKDVLALAERLRQPVVVEPSRVAVAITPMPAVYAPPAAPPQSVPLPTPTVAIKPKSSRLKAGLAAAGGLLALTVAAWFIRNGGNRSATAMESGPLIAVGNIAAFSADSAQATLTAPVADLLTTSLARVRSIRVVSRARMLELMRSASGASGGDSLAGRFVDAARRAGAGEIIDGTLYVRPGGRLRLDLRRVDMRSGAIGEVYTVEGNDVFALVDSGTTKLVLSLGGAAPAGSVSDVTTRSVAAYRLYEQGMRAFYRGENATAFSSFEAALAEDSLFALAAYYSAQSAPAAPVVLARLERARQLAARASDRERLMILAGWALTVSSPTFGALAETLVTRYPSEVVGHVYQGMARVFDGDFIAGLEPLQRAVAMDSLIPAASRTLCNLCDALKWRVSAYVGLDSLGGAEREARRWLRLQPSTDALMTLVNVLELAARSADVDSIFQTVALREMPYATTFELHVLHLIRAGDYASADRMLLAELRNEDPRQQMNAYWDLAISLREQGRLVEALDAARRMRGPMARSGDVLRGIVPINVMEGQVLLDMGRPAAAAPIFDSLATQHASTEAPSQVARGTAWMLAQVAGARLAAGDTASLPKLADSIRVLGEKSGYGRDRRLHHYVRGLVAASRGRDAEAIDELRASIYSLPIGFTRANCALARAYLRAGRPNEAVAVLQPALRGALDGSNLYVSRIEVHELLAQAWDAAGRHDSAAAHYAVVARAWAAGDAPFKARAERARTRELALRK